MAKPTKISDKVLNFPNPQFVKFMKRMWSSEPVSQAEKDVWAAGNNNPHEPLIIVSNATLPVVAENVDYILHSFLLPDMGDDLGIEAVSASSSSFLNFTNGGPFNINGMIARHGSLLHFNLDLNFYVESSIVAVLDYRNGTSTEAIVQSISLAPTDDGYVELFNGLRFTASSPTYNLKLGLLIDKDANTIRLVVTYNAANNSTNQRFNQRYETRRY